MSNNLPNDTGTGLDNIRDKILAKGLMTLRELAVMPRFVNGSYSKEAAEFGDTIDVPLPQATTVADVTPSNVLPDAVERAPAKVQILLDQWRKSAPFGLTDKELREVDKNAHFFPMQADEAIKALGNDVNEKIHATYKGIYGYVGTAGTTPFEGVTDATNARKVLNQQLAPRQNRRGVLDFDAEAAALALSPFSDADKIGDNGVKIEGEIGRKYGIDWAADDAVVTHTATAGANYLGNDAAPAIGDTTITSDTGSGGDPLPGDIFTIDGDTQTYVVESYAANVITQQPALKVAVADSAAITFKATHVVNLAFHRDAFAFANRPLLVSSADRGARNFRSLTDPVTGISLRLEIIPEYKQTVWEFDILFGVKLVRPELACRISG